MIMQIVIKTFTAKQELLNLKTSSDKAFFVSIVPIASKVEHKKLSFIGFFKKTKKVFTCLYLRFFETMNECIYR